jgi:hypothetical protein
MRLWQLHALLLGFFAALFRGAIITGGRIIEGAYRGYTSAGAPSAGTERGADDHLRRHADRRHLQAAFDGFTTGDIAWSATNATRWSRTSTPRWRPCRTSARAASPRRSAP